MNIALKLIPAFDDTCSIDQQCLSIPVNFTYEDIDRSFVFSVSSGLNIIGKQCPESRFIAYFIGDTCTLDTLSEFTNKVAKGLPSSLVIGSSEDGMSTSSLEYNAGESTWTHRTESIDKHTGGSLTFKLSPASLKRFVESINRYMKFARMQIEGHKALWTMGEKEKSNLDTH